MLLFKQIRKCLWPSAKAMNWSFKPCQTLDCIDGCMQHLFTSPGCQTGPLCFICCMGYKALDLTHTVSYANASRPIPDIAVLCSPIYCEQTAPQYSHFFGKILNNKSIT